MAEESIVFFNLGVKTFSLLFQGNYYDSGFFSKDN